MKKILLVLMLLCLVVVVFSAPAVAFAQTSETPASTQEAIATFLAPLAWLVPVVVALVNRFKGGSKALPGWLVIAFSAAIGVVCVAVAIYFPEMNLAMKVVVAGVALGLAASGVFDLFKLFGTFGSTSEPGA